MTDQVLDTVRYRGARYDLVDYEGAGLFEPAAHGLAVVAASSECWRGYACAYELAAERLELDALEAMSGRYDGDAYLAVEPPPIHGRAPARMPPKPFNTVYEHLALPIAFTGQLLLGGELLGEVVRDAGTVPWRYARAYVLRFAAGALVATEEVSAAFAAVRARAAVRGELAAARPDLAWIFRGA